MLASSVRTPARNCVLPCHPLLQPNGYIFTSLINACEKGGQWERAVALFKVMQASGWA